VWVHNRHRSREPLKSVASKPKLPASTGPVQGGTARSGGGKFACAVAFQSLPTLGGGCAEPATHEHPFVDGPRRLVAGTLIARQICKRCVLDLLLLFAWSGKATPTTRCALPYEANSDFAVFAERRRPLPHMTVKCQHRSVDRAERKSDIDAVFFGLDALEPGTKRIVATAQVGCRYSR